MAYGQKEGKSVQQSSALDLFQLEKMICAKWRTLLGYKQSVHIKNDVKICYNCVNRLTEKKGYIRNKDWYNNLDIRPIIP